MDLKRFAFLTLLLFGSTWAACIPLNLSNLNGTNYSASLDQCYDIVFDGANVTMTINNPNSTAPHQAHLNLSFTPGASAQTYNNPTEDLNISIGAAPVCNPFVNVSIALSPNNTFQIASGAGYLFTANYTGPHIASSSTALQPGGFASVLDPTTGALISTVSCQQQAICTVSQNYTWSWSGQTFINTTSPCNVSLNIEGVPASIAYANVSSNYTSPGVFFDSAHNTTVVCSPQTATCPVLPSGQFNLTPGQITTIQNLTLDCPLQTQTITKIVPYSDEYNNITAGISTIKVSVPTSVIRSIQDMNDLQNGNIYGLIDRQNASVSAQLTGMTTQANFLSDQIYNPTTGWRANYSALYTLMYGTNGNQSWLNQTDSKLAQAQNDSQSQTGLWMIFTVLFGLGALVMFVLLIVKQHTSQGPRHDPPSAPLSGSAAGTTFAERASRRMMQRENKE